MKQNYFLDRNVLWLLPENNQCLSFHCDFLKNKIKNFYRLNFVEYSHQNGTIGTETYIANLIDDKQIDILIASSFATDYQLSVEFYASLKNKAKVVFWMWDDENYFDVYSRYYCQTADAVITTDYFSIFAYQKLGIPAILYQSSHSRNNYFPVEIEKDIDVCFLGNCRKNDRMDYINFLIKNGTNVETFGLGSKNGFVNWDEFSKIFSRSKINLNFTKIDKLSWINKDNPLLNRVRQNKGRPIESALTKSFCLSEYAPALNTIFEIGKEIDIFYGKADLVEKVRYYLSHDEKREEIANNAYKRAIDNYESEVYISKILNELEEILQKNDKQRTEKIEIYLSMAFKIKSINGLIFSMFIMLKNRKIVYALETFIKLFRYGIFVFLIGFYGGLARVLKSMLNETSKTFTRREGILF